MHLENRVSVTRCRLRRLTSLQLSGVSQSVNFREGRPVSIRLHSVRAHLSQRWSLNPKFNVLQLTYRVGVHRTDHKKWLTTNRRLATGRQVKVGSCARQRRLALDNQRGRTFPLS